MALKMEPFKPGKKEFNLPSPGPKMDPFVPEPTPPPTPSPSPFSSPRLNLPQKETGLQMEPFSPGEYNLDVQQPPKSEIPYDFSGGFPQADWRKMKQDRQYFQENAQMFQQPPPPDFLDSSAPDKWVNEQAGIPPESPFKMSEALKFALPRAFQNYISMQIGLASPETLAALIGSSGIAAKMNEHLDTIYKSGNANYQVKETMAKGQAAELSTQVKMSPMWNQLTSEQQGQFERATLDFYREQQGTNIPGVGERLTENIYPGHHLRQSLETPEGMPPVGMENLPPWLKTIAAYAPEFLAATLPAAKHMGFLDEPVKKTLSKTYKGFLRKGQKVADTVETATLEADFRAKLLGRKLKRAFSKADLPEEKLIPPKTIGVPGKKSIPPSKPVGSFQKPPVLSGPTIKSYEVTPIRTEPAATEGFTRTSAPAKNLTGISTRTGTSSRVAKFPKSGEPGITQPGSLPSQEKTVDEFIMRQSGSDRAAWMVKKASGGKVNVTKLPAGTIRIDGGTKVIASITQGLKQAGMEKKKDIIVRPERVVLKTDVSKEWFANWLQEQKQGEGLAKPPAPGEMKGLQMEPFSPEPVAQVGDLINRVNNATTEKEIKNVWNDAEIAGISEDEKFREAIFLKNNQIETTTKGKPTQGKQEEWESQVRPETRRETEAWELHREEQAEGMDADDLLSWGEYKEKNKKVFSSNYNKLQDIDRDYFTDETKKKLVKREILFQGWQESKSPEKLREIERLEEQIGKTTQKREGKIYRGISHEEMENIANTGEMTHSGDLSELTAGETPGVRFTNEATSAFDYAQRGKGDNPFGYVLETDQKAGWIPDRKYGLGTLEKDILYKGRDSSEIKGIMKINRKTGKVAGRFTSINDLLENDANMNRDIPEVSQEETPGDLSKYPGSHKIQRQDGDVQLFEVDPGSLHLDPERFQYKLQTKKETGIEKGTERAWNQKLAGDVHVWMDPADGKLYVVNGHHRYNWLVEENKKRATQGKKLLKMPSVIILQDMSAEEARAFAARINIAEGKGKVIDAATFFREKKMNVVKKSVMGKLKPILEREAKNVFKKQESSRDKQLEFFGGTGESEGKIGESETLQLDTETMGESGSQGLKLSGKQGKQSGGLKSSISDSFRDPNFNSEQFAQKFLSTPKGRKLFESSLPDEFQIKISSDPKKASEQVRQLRNKMGITSDPIADKINPKLEAGIGMTSQGAKSIGKSILMLLRKNKWIRETINKITSPVDSDENGIMWSKKLDVRDVGFLERWFSPMSYIAELNPFALDLVKSGHRLEDMRNIANKLGLEVLPEMKMQGMKGLDWLNRIAKSLSQEERRQLGSLLLYGEEQGLDVIPDSEDNLRIQSPKTSNAYKEIRKYYNKSAKYMRKHLQSKGILQDESGFDKTLKDLQTKQSEIQNLLSELRQKTPDTKFRRIQLTRKIVSVEEELKNVEKDIYLLTKEMRNPGYKAIREGLDQQVEALEKEIEKTQDEDYLKKLQKSLDSVKHEQRILKARKRRWGVAGYITHIFDHGQYKILKDGNLLHIAATEKDVIDFIQRNRVADGLSGRGYEVSPEMSDRQILLYYSNLRQADLDRMKEDLSLGDYYVTGLKIYPEDMKKIYNPKELQMFEQSPQKFKEKKWGHTKERTANLKYFEKDPFLQLQAHIKGMNNKILTDIFRDNAVGLINNIDDAQEELKAIMKEYVQTMSGSMSESDRYLLNTLRKITPLRPFADSLGAFPATSMSNFFKAIQAIGKIGWRVKSAYVNYFQVLTRVAPIIGEKKVLRGYKDLATGKFKQKLEDEGIALIMPADMHTGIADMGRDFSSIFDMPAEWAKEKTGFLPKPFKAILHKIINISKPMHLFNSADSVNRGCTMIAGYYHAREVLDYDEEKAWEYARLLTSSTQIRYGLSDKPKVFRGPGLSTLFQFKRYGFHMISSDIKMLAGGMGKSELPFQDPDWREYQSDILELAQSEQSLEGKLNVIESEINNLSTGLKKANKQYKIWRNQTVGFMKAWEPVMEKAIKDTERVQESFQQAKAAFATLEAVYKKRKAAGIETKMSSALQQAKNKLQQAGRKINEWQTVKKFVKPSAMDRRHSKHADKIQKAETRLNEIEKEIVELDKHKTKERDSIKKNLKQEKGTLKAIITGSKKQQRDIEQKLKSYDSLYGSALAKVESWQETKAEAENTLNILEKVFENVPVGMLESSAKRILEKARRSFRQAKQQLQIKTKVEKTLLNMRSRRITRNMIGKEFEWEERAKETRDRLDVAKGLLKFFKSMAEQAKNERRGRPMPTGGGDSPIRSGGIFKVHQLPKALLYHFLVYGITGTGTFQLIRAIVRKATNKRKDIQAEAEKKFNPVISRGISSILGIDISGSGNYWGGVISPFTESERPQSIPMSIASKFVKYLSSDETEKDYRWWSLAQQFIPLELQALEKSRKMYEAAKKKEIYRGYSPKVGDAVVRGLSFTPLRESMLRAKRQREKELQRQYSSAKKQAKRAILDYRRKPGQKLKVFGKEFQSERMLKDYLKNYYWNMSITEKELKRAKKRSQTTPDKGSKRPGAWKNIHENVWGKNPFPGETPQQPTNWRSVPAGRER